MSTNVYDPYLQEKVDALKERITHELMPIGEVTGVTGHITPFRDGYLLQNVRATVGNSVWGSTVEVAVGWDTSVDAPFYTREGNRIFPGDAISPYDVEASLTARMVASTMQRMRELVTERTRELRAANSPSSTAGWLCTVGVLGVLAMIDVWIWRSSGDSVGLRIFLIICGTLFFGFLLALPTAFALDGRDLRRKTKALTAWETCREEAFYDLFEDIQGRTVFLGHLVQMCEDRGYVFHGNVKLRDDTVTRDAEASPLTAPVVEFEVTSPSDGKVSQVIYDGMDLFHYYRSESLDEIIIIHVYRIDPLPAS